MPYPKKLLNDNETVALDLHPHWWFFAKPAAALVVSIVVGIVALRRGRRTLGNGLKADRDHLHRRHRVVDRRPLPASG